MPSYIQDVEKEKAAFEEEEIEESSDGPSRMPLILLVGLLVVAGLAGAEFLFNIVGIFGKKEEKKSSYNFV